MTDLIKAADALAEAVNEQLSYMDLCGDKGDLERNMRTTLTAYRQARESADGVKVKPLVWVKPPDWKDCDLCSEDGFYEICEGQLLFNPGSEVGSIFETLEDAKAAAQADYEARIKAALDPQ
jgi:hypothetical protein